jgi:hypothetical protein
MWKQKGNWVEYYVFNCFDNFNHLRRDPISEDEAVKNCVF